ncbi:MAG: chorismate synthase, partial [Flavobacteriales bacterium]|nr:chorismate synthase [Flavobacteriales bacterium]
VFEGKTTGTPIGFVIFNEDARSKDYSHVKDTFRPSHADFTYEKKFGARDYRGGGRSSARETACRVVAGAIATQLLAQQGITINAWVNRVKDIALETPYSDLNLNLIESNIVRCPEPETAEKMIALIDATRKAGNTVGGSVFCVVQGVPVGWGEPVFGKLHANLATAMMGINATRYFEIGSGKGGTFMTGSEHNDPFVAVDGNIGTSSNRSGGVQGGISNGEDIYFELGFKPVATIIQKQQSVDKEGNEVEVQGRGRHDPCVLPRAVPIVEAMAALVLVDAMLLARANRL